MEPLTNASPTPALDKALVAAQAAATPAEHDAENDFAGYAYTSAEQVIHLCSEWLNTAGLALAPLESSLHQLGENIIMKRAFVLAHESGEQRRLTQDWPVMPGKGRPLDKAVAAADTASLSYLLRTLLLMPRVEEGVDLDSPRPEDGNQGHRQEPRGRDRGRDQHRDWNSARAPDDGGRADGHDSHQADAHDDGPPADDDEPREITDLRQALRKRAAELPDCAAEQITDELLDDCLVCLIDQTFGEVSVEDAADLLDRLPHTDDDRLTELIGGCLVPF